ncbi:hypothetical protein [Marinigracilibium pacificum]|uniref:VCBS repeat protein n=1 Tax=Marinigracilibium pacificum TaxID=2729599 RepID=A0A848IVG1_9BACT|nr:hypothetical protein [Marinigracilibium pacificum]NMM47676.1 hypothetical protein [Marinigracilibium pacificum]
MIRVILLNLLLISSYYFLSAQDFTKPDCYILVDSVSGDLDKDGIKELVVAYNTQEEVDFESVPRELIIYKTSGKEWTIWKRSKLALYSSRDGGMMGDPYGSMEIEKGILLINQNGGSSWKWGFTDKYRYQNGEFYLIGYTSFGGKLCEYWESVDFNLSTGKINVSKEYENCENGDQSIYKTESESFFEKGLKITLQNRQEKTIKITSPKYNHQIYISAGQ